MRGRIWRNWGQAAPILLFRNLGSCAGNLEISAIMVNQNCLQVRIMARAEPSNRAASCHSLSCLLPLVLWRNWNSANGGEGFSVSSSLEGKWKSFIEARQRVGDYIRTRRDTLPCLFSISLLAPTDSRAYSSVEAQPGLQGTLLYNCRSIHRNVWVVWPRERGGKGGSSRRREGNCLGLRFLPHISWTNSSSVAVRGCSIFAETDFLGQDEVCS